MRYTIRYELTDEADDSFYDDGLLVLADSDEEALALAEDRLARTFPQGVLEEDLEIIWVEEED